MQKKISLAFYCDRPEERKKVKENVFLIMQNNGLRGEYSKILLQAGNKGTQDIRFIFIFQGQGLL